MTIRTILERKGGAVIGTTADATLGEVAALLAEHRIGALPVMDGDELLGVISERDIVTVLAQQGAGGVAVRVRDAMSAPAITVAPDTPALAALSLVTTRRVRHLPVVEGGRMVGFVSIGDLVKLRMDRIEAEASAMRDYIQGT